MWVSSAYIVVNRRGVYQIANGCNVKDKEKWPQDRALKNTTRE